MYSVNASVAPRSVRVPFHPGGAREALTASMAELGEPLTDCLHRQIFESLLHDLALEPNVSQPHTAPDTVFDASTRPLLQGNLAALAAMEPRYSDGGGRAG